MPAERCTKNIENGRLTNHAKRGRLSRMGLPTSQPSETASHDASSRRGASVSVTHCVMWRSIESCFPPELLTNLSAKGIRITEVSDRYETMARVTLLERANDERAMQTAAKGATNHEDGAGTPRDAIILLMIQPDNLSGAADVYHAVQRFAPRTACWQFDARANPVLRPVVESDLAAWDGAKQAGMGPHVGVSQHSAQSPEKPSRDGSCHTGRPSSMTDAVRVDIQVRAGENEGAKNR